mgnify:CR=1 FL=1
MNLGLKAVETGAEIADKVAAEADKVRWKSKRKMGKITFPELVIS